MLNHQHLHKNGLTNLQSFVDKLNIAKIRNVSVALISLKSESVKPGSDNLIEIAVDLKQLSDVLRSVLKKKIMLN